MAIGSCILSPAIAALRPVSADSVCCFFGVAALGAVDLTGFELGRPRLKGDFAGMGGGGVEGGGEDKPGSIGGLGSGGSFGLLAYGVTSGLGCIGKAPRTGGGVLKPDGVAGLALRNELAASDSGVSARGNESDVDDKGGLRNISPEGLAGRFGGALPLRSAPGE